MAIDSHRVLSHNPIRVARVIDTVGAGDSFSAVALAGFVRGWDTAELLGRACEFASHICEVRAAVPSNLADYSDWTRGWRIGHD